ncbi:MAG: hypothetical protein U0930_25945 [Pirellulales bacterium]
MTPYPAPTRIKSTLPGLILLRSILFALAANELLMCQSFSYVSGHSTFSSGAATLLTSAYGQNYSYSTTSRLLPGVTRSIHKAPKTFPFPNAMKNSWTVIYFESLGPNQTKLIARCGLYR